MRKSLLGLVTPSLLLLGACELKVERDENGQDGPGAGVAANISISDDDGVSIAIPGGQARLKVPGLEIGADHMDINGMKPYPGTKLSGINVLDQEGEGSGRVEMRFSSPGAPDKVAAYYAAATRDAGFTDIAVKRNGAAATVTATMEDNDRLTIVAAPAPEGSTGQIVIADRTLR